MRRLDTWNHCILRHRHLVRQEGNTPPSLPIRSRSLVCMICACSMRGRHFCASTSGLLKMSSKMSRTTLFARSPMQWMFYIYYILVSYYQEKEN